MVETMCDSGAVKLKAGTNVSTALTGAQYTQLINQAESYINVITRINYTDSYGTLNADVAKLLEDTASSKAAVFAINFDPFSYNSLAEATNMINVNLDTVDRNIRLLKEKQQTDFIDGA